jgi:undecaprenyl-diphosphatase
MELLKVLVLGIVEGITEFLPISSTGHLIVASDLLKFDRGGSTFDIFIQIGAVIAVIFYYRSQLLQQAQNVPHNANTRQLWLGILIAFIPAAGLGFFLVNWIDAVLFNPTVVATALIVGGIMFILVEKNMTINPENGSIDEQPLTVRQALIVGLWQVLALIPGMSRSGMSIVGGMLAGLDRARATQFSFYLAIPTLGMATVYSLVKNLSVFTDTDMLLLIWGTIISGIVAWFSIDWLLRYVTRNNYVVFGYYRIAVGILILLMSLL